MNANTTKNTREWEGVQDNALFLSLRPRRNERGESPSCNWEEARTLLMRNDARRLVDYGDFMLYLICANANPPLDIVKSIYNLAPHQAYYQDHLMGHTPLHNACLFGSIEVVIFLLEVVPKLVIIGRNSLPFHKMISRQNRSIVKIKKLLSINPSIVHIPDQLGCKPIQIFFRNWEMTQQNYGSLWPERNNNLEMDNDQLDSSKLETDLDIFLLLLRAFTYDITINDKCNTIQSSIFERPWHPLHEAIKMEEIPIDFLAHLLHRFPEEIPKQDESGNCLLHIALMQRHLDCSVITFIMQSNPEIAKVVNGEGRLPLALAIEYGNEWENNGILQKLLKIYPDALSNPDIQTQLYPFMTALSSEKASTSLVYELLLMDPSLVAIGIPFEIAGSIAMK